MKSQKHIDQLKNDLENVLNNIDDIYYAIKSELRKEIMNEKQENIKIDKALNELYDNLSDDDCVALIKYKLPLRVKLFNKIIYHGKGIYAPGQITIDFTFGIGIYSTFQYTFNIQEIKSILKLI